MWRYASVALALAVCACRSRDGGTAATATASATAAPTPSASATAEVTPRPGASADAAPTARVRWFTREHTYEDGPPMNARAPSTTFCPDGRYTQARPFAADASFPQPTRGGMACCRDERGTYELEWSDGGAPSAIRVRPESGPPRVEILGPGDALGGRAPSATARRCP